VPVDVPTTRLEPLAGVDATAQNRRGVTGWIGIVAYVRDVAIEAAATQCFANVNRDLRRSTMLRSCRNQYSHPVSSADAPKLPKR
jgi:hypothetical protein